METSGNAAASDIRIQVDNMELTVTNRYPTFGEQEKKEAWREMSACLFRIFKTYDKPYSSGGAE